MQQRPAQVGVDLEALGGLGVLEQALELVERLVGVRGGGERPDEGQLVVAAWLRVREQLAQPLLPGRLEGWPVGRREAADRLGAVAGIRLTPNASVSVPMLASTRSTKSEALISASRVMSHAAPQHSAWASESSSRDRPPTTVASDRSSRRILA